METIKIHGKEYVTVSERVKHFNKHYKGSIQTYIVEISDNHCVMEARIVDGDDVVIRTGHAREERSEKGINSSSFVENCETSAVGRALGFLGIGIDGGIASLDEILSARQYEYITKLLDLASITDQDREKIESNLKTMTTGDAEQVIRFLQIHLLDPIESGAGYSQKDINKRLDDIDSDPKK
jgi:hypothetical protein